MRTLHILIGPHSSGKTAMASALSSYTKQDIHDASNNGELVKVLENSPNGKGDILVCSADYRPDYGGEVLRIIDGYDKVLIVSMSILKH